MEIAARVSAGLGVSAFVVTTEEEDGRRDGGRDLVGVERSIVGEATSPPIPSMVE